jgi:acylphosphatase
MNVICSQQLLHQIFRRLVYCHHDKPLHDELTFNINSADFTLWMKLKITIHGPMVHNVGYRYFLLNNADNIGLKGFSARNLRSNGKQYVQILVEGDDCQIQEFQETAKTQYPKAAKVAEVAFEDYQDRVESLAKFAFRFQSLQVSKGIESIIRIEKLQETMLEKQDQMLGKQDQMLGKQDQMLGKQDQMLGKQDQMLGKQDQMLGKQDQMLSKQDQMLSKQDQMLGKQDQILDKLENVRLDIVDEIRTSSESLVSELRNSGERNAVHFRDCHSDLKSYLDEKLGKIEVDISRIKARIGM